MIIIDNVNNFYWGQPHTSPFKECITDISNQYTVYSLLPFFDSTSAKLVLVQSDANALDTVLYNDQTAALWYSILTR
jgi:hypothetical protein